MQTITLGESGLECSRLAYGCWRVTGVIILARIAEEHENKGHKAIALSVVHVCVNLVQEVGYKAEVVGALAPSGVSSPVLPRVQLSEAPLNFAPKVPPVVIMLGPSLGAALIFAQPVRQVHAAPYVGRCLT